MLMTIGFCIFGGQPMMITMRRRLSIPSDAFGRTGTKGKGLIKSAGVGRRSDLSVFISPWAFRGGIFLNPFISSFLFSTIICFGSGWHLLVPVFCFSYFHDISWTLMTQTTVTSLTYHTLHTHTYIAHLPFTPYYT